MKLRGIKFGSVLDASGVEAFFREGYWWHELFRALFDLDFTGSTFVAKTTTLPPRPGNMPLKKDGITPKERIPKCIKVYLFRGGGMVLNAVGLSGPGAEKLFMDGRWQKIKEPFFISFMSDATGSENKITELEFFVEMFARYLPDFNARPGVGLQLNYSCPNTDTEQEILVDEVTEGLAIANRLNIPLMPKFSIITPVKTVKKISDSPHCDAICVSNSIPWGKQPCDIDWRAKIDWDGLFGTNESPLAEFGGGGLSGRPLFEPVLDWIIEARKAGIKKPINAGGGILSPRDVNTLYYVLNDRNSSVFVGSAAILRPPRVRGIIQRAHQLFGV